MEEYISKERINNLLENHLDHWCGPEHYACTIIQDEINNAPTVYVKHGYWIEEKHSHWSESWGRVGSYSYTYQCSECAHHFQLPHNYCPDCGSKNTLKTKGGYNLGW